MIKYITVLDSDTITLGLMGRKKTFNNGDEVNDDAYVKAYPQHFERIGEIKGLSSFLSTPIFVPDTILDFVEKEKVRKETIQAEFVKPTEVTIDKLADELEDKIEEALGVDIDKEDIIKMLDKEVQEETEDETEDEVTIEIEE